MSDKLAFSAKKAHATQLRLSRMIVFEDRLAKKIGLVGGVDAAYAGGMSVGAAVVLDYDSLRLVEAQVTVCETVFPYVPTLLSFREIPPAVQAIRKLRVMPDVFLVDGQGFMHPYRCGFASHLGIVLNMPTIGVAKSRLIGEAECTNAEDEWVSMKYKGEVVGAEVTTRKGCRPVYVSVGHMVSLERAIEVVKHCARGCRVPKPVLEAHRLAAQEKRKINNGIDMKR